MHRTRRATVAVVAAIVAIGLTGCGTGGGAGSGAGTDAVTVLVDYQHDEFATSHLEYYPKIVKVHPGSTVVFKQAWTGEPHSVTFGKLVDKHMQIVSDFLIKNGDKPMSSDEPPPAEVMPALEGMDTDLVYMLDGDADGLKVKQGAAQPCFLKTGTYPDEGETPCPEVDQPVFDGSYDIYNSGFIPYEGSKQSNTFTVDFADDIAPGTYNYYCNIHGPAQWGRVEVVPPQQDVPSKADVAKQARAEALEDIKFLEERLARAQKTGKTEVDGEELKGNLTGIEGQFPAVHAFVDEFTPKTIKAKARTPVSWTIVGTHTISFNVPKYFPYFTVDEDGTVKANPDAYRAVGFPAPPQEEDGPPDGEGGEGGAPPSDEGPPREEQEEGEQVVLDAGDWDGKGFRSTGSDYPTGATFKVTFTKKGTYTYACLLHPAMVGKVEIT